jgi:hypothetical protein
VPGDAKALAKIHDAKGEELYVVTQNQDSLMVYAKSVNDTKKQMDQSPAWRFFCRYVV